MQNIIIKEDIIPKIEQLIKLYEDVKWIAYTKNPEVLEKAVNNCLKVWTAWEGDKLVGLVRIVGDGYTIIYIQDILVLEDYQRRGIGSEFLKLILEKYESVRQIILLTEDTEKTVKYYEKNGLVKSTDYNAVAFMK